MSTDPPMNTPEMIQAITLLIEVFESFGMVSYIGEPATNAVHGKRRTNQDEDLYLDGNSD